MQNVWFVRFGRRKRAFRGKERKKERVFCTCFLLSKVQSSDNSDTLNEELPCNKCKTYRNIRWLCRLRLHDPLNESGCWKCSVYLVWQMQCKKCTKLIDSLAGSVDAVLKAELVSV